MSLLCGGALAAAVLAVMVPLHPAARQAPLRERYLARVTTTLGEQGVRRVRGSSWWGRTYAIGAGETVNVNVSASYPADDAVGQSWANFFGGLVHGNELQLLQAYVATPAEVQMLCGSSYALGCYGGNRLIVIGEPSHDVDPHEVGAHEYGHHVAANRLNPPWSTADWGTKRWASYAGICQRVSAGTAYPGDEDQHYAQNPGEAFAEVYRALNDSRAGLPLIWEIVDSSFIPDAAALQAAQEDVLEPWASPAIKMVRGRFTAQGRKIWKLALSTRLDGLLDVDLAMPRGTLYDLALLAADGHTVLARGLWTGTTEKKLSYTLCGQRSLFLRVTRMGSGGPFSITITQP